MRTAAFPFGTWSTNIYRITASSITRHGTQLDAIPIGTSPKPNMSNPLFFGGVIGRASSSGPSGQMRNISLTWHRLLLGIVIYPLHSRDHFSDVYDVQVHHGYGWVSAGSHQAAFFWSSPRHWPLQIGSFGGTNHFINCAAWCLAACGCRTTIFNKWIE
jgi:hypothetical protein